MALPWCAYWVSTPRSGLCWKASRVAWPTSLLPISTPTSWPAWMKPAISLFGAWPWRMEKSSIFLGLSCGACVFWHSLSATQFERGWHLSHETTSPFKTLKFCAKKFSAWQDLCILFCKISHPMCKQNSAFWLQKGCSFVLALRIGACLIMQFSLMLAFCSIFWVLWRYIKNADSHPLCDDKVNTIAVLEILSVGTLGGTIGNHKEKVSPKFKFWNWFWVIEPMEGQPGFWETQLEHRQSSFQATCWTDER